MAFKSGFVSIFGKPNAGKSTLLNVLIGEKMAIVSHKVQTTRHRIKAFLNSTDYQIVFSDTPGIIDPQYRLHQKMMQQVKSAMEDADAALLLYDITDKDPEAADALFASLKLKVPAIVLVNKTDLVPAEATAEIIGFFTGKRYAKAVIGISAKKKTNTETLVTNLLQLLPEGEPFFPTDDLSDLPTKFFVSELIREKIFELYHEEIPYHTAVIVQEFTPKSTLIKIRAEIIVQRETQKFIIIGEGGKMIKKLGTEARQGIEAFIDNKVFLELFVKVKPKWRDDELKLREYGY
ncbi:MAG: GTPase Era [Bacteroidetes bacterium]|nr:MAG: GTPase Era [Bacteroidota bacterium]